MNISLMVLKKLLRNASKISDDQAQMAFYTMFDYCIKGQVSEPYGLYYNKTENGIKREIWHSPPKRYPFRVPNCILLEKLI